MPGVISKIKRLLRRGISIEHSKISFSQCGEDILIEYIFNLRGISNPSYIDIGANHPIRLNNTYKFYLKGSSGINVEPNQQLIEQFISIRPKDNNLNVGIADSASELTFYMFTDDTLNTFSYDESKKIVDAGYILIDKKTVQSKTVDDILRVNWNDSFPDLLSIDVEGLDFEIIRSINFDKYYPKIICAETAEYSPIGAGSKRLDMMDYIQSKGYTLYADTNLNSIYVKNEFWFI
jgi:FkbM family methyltransferase